MSRNVAIAVVFGLSVLSGSESHRMQHRNFAPSIPQYFYEPIPHIIQLEEMQSKSAFAPVDPIRAGLNFVNNKLNISDKDYVLKDAYTSSHNQITHIYLKQLVNALEVINGDINVNVDQSGRVVSMGSSFFTHPEHAANSNAKGLKFQKRDQFIFSGSEHIDAPEALISLTRHLELPVPHRSELQTTGGSSLRGKDVSWITGYNISKASSIEVSQKYIISKGGDHLESIWDMELELEHNWFHAQISSRSANVVALIDWVSDAEYTIFPLGINDPSDGKRKKVHDPADATASHLGWHSVPRKNAQAGEVDTYTTTMGNNVVAHENLNGRMSDDYLTKYRPDGGSELRFNFPLDLKSEPGSSIDAAISNLFYWNNVMHDVFYKYGFDEKSGNFQMDNFGRGGKGDDAVIANAQDGAGTNNANFATPPDGRNGRMRMYVWDITDPARDGDLESGIIIHEYGHGISIRLTGGPANSGCLGWGESGGMGEGWGDFWATMLRMKGGETRKTDFAMGSYAMGKDEGIRMFRYSTNLTTNPSTYGFIKKSKYYGVHAKGEVWAAILYEVYWNLVDKHGFSLDWYRKSEATDDSVDSLAGNIIALQLSVDALKLQPCRPSFVDARDAMLQADKVDFQGSNYCEIWKGFAKRGLGKSAKAGGFEAFDVPEPCKSS